MAAQRQIPRVLMISPNRSLLRQVSRFLEMFGYSVTQASTEARAVDAIEAVEPSVVLIDDALGQREYLDLCHAIRSHGVVSEAFVMLVASDFSTNALLQATASGFDDFLAKPIVHGELLARLRAAARLRTAAERDARYVDPLTGLIGRDTFEQTLINRGEAAERSGNTISCVVCGIDFLTRINRLQGRLVADGVIRKTGEMLQKCCQSDQIVGRISGDIFAVALPGFGVDEARRWAESRRRHIEENATGADADIKGITASFGVATMQGKLEGLECESTTLLGRALDALQVAKQSGRDCVVCEGEFAEEDAILRNLAAPGRMFENTVARDVMTPCPIVLQADHSAAEALKLLRRSGTMGAPVADERGELLGFVSVEHLLQGLADGASGSTIVESADVEAVAFESQTPFGELFNFFINRPNAEVVVVEQSHPVGVITREGLTALVEPVRCRRNTPEDERTRNQQEAAGFGATAS